MSLINGGDAVVPKMITGRSLVHRHLNSRQKACLAADVIEGRSVIIPTHKQVAAVFGVNLVYVDLARKLAPGKRTAIAQGLDSTSFAKLLRQTKPMKVVNPVITDVQLVEAIRRIGIERVLNAAIKAEATQ